MLDVIIIIVIFIININNIIIIKVTITNLSHWCASRMLYAVPTHVCRATS